MGRVFDLSIPLDFRGPQPSVFGAPSASAEPLVAGPYVGDTRRGGSANCSVHAVIPHCQGIHTETVGHLTDDLVPVCQAARRLTVAARLLTVRPEPAPVAGEGSDPPPLPGDLLITRRALEAASGGQPPQEAALILRTLPNDPGKSAARWGERPAPFFTREAMDWVVARGVEHLLFDGPSLDRLEDQGRLTAHRIFWGLPAGSREARAAARPEATVTELIFVPDEAVDGPYSLSLQIAPWVADAAPSRPLIQEEGP